MSKLKPVAPDELSGVAAVTLVEALIIHLQEIGTFSEGDRDWIYQLAIKAHKDVGADPDHQAVSALLQNLHGRTDGATILGDVMDG